MLMSTLDTYTRASLVAKIEPPSPEAVLLMKIVLLMLTIPLLMWSAPPPPVILYLKLNGPVFITKQSEHYGIGMILQIVQELYG